MSLNPTTTGKGRPVATYGKKLHTDDQTISTLDTKSQTSSGFLFGAGEDDDENENNFGDFLGQSIFDKPKTASVDSTTAMKLAPTIVHSPPIDDIEMPDMPLTPRSKLAAELKSFEESQNNQKPKEHVYKTPFKLIGLDDDESEEESDDAFMERFRQEMKERSATKNFTDSTSTIKETVTDSAVSSIENSLPDLPGTSIPDALATTSTPSLPKIVPKVSTFPQFSEDEKESDFSDSEDERNLFVHRLNPPSVLANLPAEAVASKPALETREKRLANQSHTDLLIESESEIDKQPTKSSLTEKTKKVFFLYSIFFLF